MKKIFAALALMSASAYAQECRILVSSKSANAFYTKAEADKFCEQFSYSQIPCYVEAKSDRSWIGRIDFNDVFSGSDASFKAARTEAYRNYFTWLDSKQIYNLRSTFSVKFDCKSY